MRMTTNRFDGLFYINLYLRYINMFCYIVNINCTFTLSAEQSVLVFRSEDFKLAKSELSSTKVRTLYTLLILTRG